MNQAPYFLNRGSRVAVLEALWEVCSHRGWHQDVQEAIRQVVEEQGEPMEVFVAQGCSDASVRSLTVAAR